MSTTRDDHDSSGERRDGQAPRLQFEALVEVGARSVGGFEAESVDVSLDGIRLRTAYLPVAGEKLVCRFDGFGGEIVAEGEVAWCNDEGRGGEFGVRFTNLDARAMILLEKMCAPDIAEQPAEPSDPEAAALGTRVRLHIQGLGSPMRARVRDVARGEMLVGSNLEFLRVGRDVELEDVEQGGKRVANIEHVGVDIDPETRIPQLVVALNFTDLPLEQAAELERAQEPVSAQPASSEDEDLTTAPYQVRQGAIELDARRAEPTPAPADTDEEPMMAGEAQTPSEIAASEVALTPSGRMAQVDLRPSTPNEESDLDDDIDRSVTPATVRAARQVGKLATKLRPGFASAGAVAGAGLASAGAGLASAGKGAKGALGKMLAAVKKKREARRDTRAKDQAARAPKRTTAPPPSGALRSDGKRLFREQQRDSEMPPEPVEPPPKTDKKRTAFGVVIGMMAVLAIYFVSSRLSTTDDASPDPAAAKTEQVEEVGAEKPAAALGQPAAPAPGGGVATANVPLFGATPLSTTEAVPVPPDLSGDASKKDEAKDDAVDANEKEKKKTDLRKDWGFGELHNPFSLRLKMDGKLAGIIGTETATGFSIKVPGRKSISSAAGMARKDKRIESVNVVNYPDYAEVTVRFKGEVPSFAAKVKGKRLVIEISSQQKKKKKSKKDKKRSKKKKKKKKN